VRTFVLITLLLVAFDARAEVTLFELFANNMVLQRDAPVPIWGKAGPNTKLVVQFAGQKVSATADGKGAWRAAFQPLKMSKEPQTLTINVAEKEVVSLKNMCSGNKYIWFNKI